MKRAAHHGHATEGATCSDNRGSWSLINEFCTSYCIYVTEEGYKIEKVEIHLKQIQSIGTFFYANSLS